MANTIKSITYKVFAEWAIALASGDEPDGYNAELFIEKAQKLLEREDKKSEYSKSNKKPSVSKVSDTTKNNADAILSVLTTEPMTTAEINAALGEDFEPLTVSNAIRYISGENGHGIAIIKSKKMEQVTRVKSGVECKEETLKTAYALAE